GKNLVDIKNIITVKGNPDEVSTMIGTSLTNIASFEELLGGETQIDILKYFDEIDKLLNQAKISYRNGDTKTAFDLATRAYLDNYEFIEGPLGEIDPVLVLKIETAMRVDLRNIIKSNESADKVDAQIDMILSDLAQARNVIPEFGTIAMVILSVALISIIGMTAKSRLSIRL
ncbi:MAG: PEFG-CTERM sorting domain-containing protein, partial [Nitrosarchaeum sp.]